MGGCERGRDARGSGNLVGLHVYGLGFGPMLVFITGFSEITARTIAKNLNGTYNRNASGSIKAGHNVSCLGFEKV